MAEFPVTKPEFIVPSCVNLSTYIQGMSDYEVRCYYSQLVQQWATEWAKMQVEWNSQQEAFESFKSYVKEQLTTFQDWFDNLDVQNEINTKIDEMVSDGTFLTIIQSTVNSQTKTATDAWLQENMTPGAGAPALDSSLTLANAAAQSKEVGDQLNYAAGPFSPIPLSLTTLWVYNNGTLTTSANDDPYIFNVKKYNTTTSSFFGIGAYFSIRFRKYFSNVSEDTKVLIYISLKENVETSCSIRFTNGSSWGIDAVSINLLVDSSGFYEINFPEDAYGNSYTAWFLTANYNYANNIEWCFIAKGDSVPSIPDNVVRNEINQLTSRLTSRMWDYKPVELELYGYYDSKTNFVAKQGEPSTFASYSDGEGVDTLYALVYRVTENNPPINNKGRDNVFQNTAVICEKGAANTSIIFSPDNTWGSAIWCNGPFEKGTRSVVLDEQYNGSDFNCKYVLLRAHTGDKLEDFGHISIYPWTIEQYKELEPISKWDGKKIVCYGDSITAANKYEPIVAEATGANVINMGMGGTRICGGENSLSDDARLATIPTDADMVIIMGGTNDFQWSVIGDAVEYEGSAYKKDTVMSALAYIIAYINEHCENAIPVVATNIGGRGEPGQIQPLPMVANTGVGKGGTPLDIRDAEIKTAAVMNTPVCDTWSCGINGINRVRYIADNVHPNDEGYKLVANYIIGFLNTINPIN